MTQPAESMTTFSMKTGDFNELLGTAKQPVLQHLCEEEGLPTAGRKEELASRIWKRVEEAQPKYQRQQKMIKLMAEEIGSVFFAGLQELLAKQFEGLATQLREHTNKQFEEQRKLIAQKFEDQRKQVATMAKQMDDLLAYLSFDVESTRGRLEEIRRNGEQQAAESRQAAINDENCAAGQ